jgi:hypothetical protein
MSFPTDLRYFAEREFAHPELLDPLILHLFDEVRHRAGVPIRVSSDGRTMAETIALYPNDPTGQQMSVHPRGFAIDGFPVPFNADGRLRFLYGVTSLYVEAKDGRLPTAVAGRLGGPGFADRLGLEIANRHFHVDVDTKLTRPHFWLGTSK